MRYPGTVSYPIPSVIPSTAKNVLVYAHMYTGINNKVQQHTKIYTQDGNNKRYEKYLYSFSYGRSPNNINSENMWFPMPANRKIYTTLTHSAGTYSALQVFVIGYN